MRPRGMNARDPRTFTEPPEPDVYGIERVDPTPVPPEFAAEDDVNAQNYVPAPCQVACPIGTDAPSYIAYIWDGKIEEAFEAITATNPFSSVCGRVCDAPCEPACRRAESDGPIAIRNLKRFVMDRLGKDHRLPSVPVTKKETVGIVGGGPAGLTAAQDLAEAGYAVDVYELTEMLGGYMTWGIPAFRCPPEIFKEDIDRMLDRCPGITVHLNTGDDVVCRRQVLYDVVARAPEHPESTVRVAGGEQIRNDVVGGVIRDQHTVTAVVGGPDAVEAIAGRIV